MSDAPERCPYQIGPHDSMGCAACEDGLRAENTRLREALKRLRDMPSPYGEFQIAMVKEYIRRTLKELEADDE